MNEGVNKLEKINIRVAKLPDVESLVKFNQLMAWETEQKKLDEGILSKGVSALIVDDNKAVSTWNMIQMRNVMFS